MSCQAMPPTRSAFCLTFPMFHNVQVEKVAHTNEHRHSAANSLHCSAGQRPRLSKCDSRWLLDNPRIAVSTIDNLCCCPVSSLQPIKRICWLQLSTSLPQQLPIAPPLPPSALGSSLIQPFFQNEEMARFLGYNAAQPSSQHESASLHSVPHGTTSTVQGSVAQLSQNRPHSQHHAASPVQTALPSVPVSVAHPGSTALSASPTPPSLMTPYNITPEPSMPLPHALPQSSCATFAPPTQPSRVPLSPFMADAEHSYASPAFNAPPAQMAWEAFGNPDAG